ncbi:hypothetical protein C0991_004007 [Blastosporella zonata]|nr:hypothetical protein C0991_004007 [Blastosporella zonata]
MPSFRSIFLVAATAFAALSSAAPVAGEGVTQVAQLVGVADVANDVLGKTVVHNVEVEVATIVKRQVVGSGLGDLTHDISITDGLAHALGRRDASVPKSLPVILLGLKADLLVVSDELNTLAIGKVVVDTALLVTVLDKVQSLLCGALDAVKLIVNNPIDVVLTLEGKVLAVVDICAILLAVLTLVGAILSCVLRLVASLSLVVVAPLVAGVSTVLCELLVCILKLVPGLFVALHPTLGPIITLFVGLKLDAVVEILHGKF